MKFNEKVLLTAFTLTLGLGGFALITFTAGWKPALGLFMVLWAMGVGKNVN